MTARTMAKWAIKLEPIFSINDGDIFDALPLVFEVDAPDDGLAMAVRDEMLRWVYGVSGDPLVVINFATGDGRLEVDVSNRSRRVWFTFSELS